MIILTTSTEIGVLVFLRKYSIPMIFKYNLNCENQEDLTFYESIWLVSLTYFSIICKSSKAVILLVKIIILVWLECIKSTIMSNLIFLSILLRCYM